MRLHRSSVICTACLRPLYISFPVPPVPRPLLLSACPMNQSGWRRVAVGQPGRPIGLVELGQDLDVQRWQQEIVDSGRVYRSNSCLTVFFLALYFSGKTGWKRLSGGWRKSTCGKGPRPDSNMVHLLSRCATAMAQHLSSLSRACVSELSACDGSSLCLMAASWSLSSTVTELCVAVPATWL